MSQQVWKYPLEFGSNKLEMPRFAKPLTCALQGTVPTLWALVDPANPKRERHFTIYGTGHDMPAQVQAANYIATFQMASGQLIFHVFETEPWMASS